MRRKINQPNRRTGVIAQFQATQADIDSLRQPFLHRIIKLQFAFDDHVSEQERSECLGD